MLPIEKQVTSKDLSKRLEEAGVKQGSVWYWQNYFMTEQGWSRAYDHTNPENKKHLVLVSHKNSYQAVDLLREIFKRHEDNPPRPEDAEQYSAFTVAEAMSMLPNYYKIYSVGYGWRCSPLEGADDGRDVVTDNIADAPAETLLYLIDQTIIKPEEI